MEEADEMLIDETEQEDMDEQKDSEDEDDAVKDVVVEEIGNVTLETTELNKVREQNPNLLPVFVDGWEPLTDTMVRNATAMEQERMLGDRLYTIIRKDHLKLAGKITGMLIEQDPEVCMRLLRRPDLLEESVREATRLIEKHESEVQMKGKKRARKEFERGLNTQQENIKSIIEGR